MEREHIPAKTDAGRDEIDNRAHKLPSALRSVLLLVDGHRSATQLREIASRLHAPDDALEQLVSMGLVAIAGAPAAAVAPGDDARTPEEANRYRILYALMTDAVREHLGVRGYFLQLKIERSVDARELTTLLPDLQTALAKRHDAGFAGDTVQRMREAADAVIG